jgi:peptidoglycan/LPS O-acetylase OafA/YrhL
MAPGPDRAYQGAVTSQTPTVAISSAVPARTHHAGIDLLRIVAALLVFAAHIQNHIGVVGGPIGQELEGGRVGVVIFFALSGYLLYRPFVLGRVSTWRYVVTRLARIYPAYLLALVGISILTADRTFLDHPAPYLLLAQNYVPELASSPFLGVAWSLQLEMTFYFLLPAVALVVQRLSRGSVGLHLAWLGLIGGLSLMSALVLSPHLVTFWQQFFPLIAWLFVPGMCLAVMEDRLPAWIGTRPVVVVGGLLVAAGAWYAPWINQDVLTAAGSATLVAWVLVRRPAMPHWVGLGAALSYAFYLWHVDVIQVVRSWGPWPAAAVIALVVTGAIAYVSYRLVERPAQDAAKGLRDRGRRAAGPPPLPVLAHAQAPESGR